MQDSAALAQRFLFTMQSAPQKEKDPRQASGQVQQGDACHNPDMKQEPNLINDNLGVK